MPGEVSGNLPAAEMDDEDWAMLRQSVTACCPRETIPDSCSCPDGCGCLCWDCDCADKGGYG